MTQKQDALDVLGPEAEALVNELEAAKTKAAPEAAIVKAEAEGCACEAKAEGCACQQEAAGAEKAKRPALAKPVEQAAEAIAEESPEPTLTMAALRRMLEAMFEAFGKSLDERLQPVEAGIGKIEAIEARVDALGATETEKVKAAVDSGGNWWDHLVKNSVQRRQAPVEGQGPQQQIDTSDPFYKVFGGLKR